MDISYFVRSVLCSVEKKQIVLDSDIQMLIISYDMVGGALKTSRFVLMICLLAIHVNRWGFSILHQPYNS